MEHLDEEQQQEQQQQQQEETVTPFDHQLSRLRANECDFFTFRETIQRAPARWTMEQALAVSEALTASKGIERLCFELAVCRPDSVRLFLDYIGSSKSMKHIAIAYDRSYLTDNGDDGDSAEQLQMYLSEMDKIFHAVLQNRSIDKLATTWLSESLSELLAKTTSLKTLEIDTVDGTGYQGDDPTHESAFHAATGFSRNTSLKQVKISCSNQCGNLGVLISGLHRHPSFEDLSISYVCPDTELYAAISKLIHFTPKLGKIVIDECSAEPGAYTAEVNFDWLLVDLYKPVLGQQACANLKVLHLIGVRIGMGWARIYEKEPTMSRDNVNNVIEELTLDQVIFVGRNAVKLLWQLVGLRKLKITEISYQEVQEDDEGWKCDRDFSCVWKGFIEHTPQLVSLVTREINEACFRGLLEAACSHKNLESLEHSSFPAEIQESRGALLGRLLQKSTSLKHLQLKCIELTADGVDQLAYGISHNQTLETLNLEESRTEPTTVTTLLGSMMVNEKLTYLSLGSFFMGIRRTTPTPYHGDFGRTLLAVLRINTTLLHLHFPHVVFNGTAMDEFFGVLADSKSRLKTLNFSECIIDSDNLVALGRCLERDNITLDKVHLSRIQSASSETLKMFIGSLKRVNRRFRVKLQKIMDRESLALLLEAAKENKNLIEFGISSGTTTATNNSDICGEIEFQLKLNRLGRGLFGSTSMHSSLWPVILAPMASDKDGPDALYYSICQYFSSSRPEQEPQELAQDSRPAKRARH